MSTDPIVLAKICFPEFNHNMVIDEHPALIISSYAMSYDIIFDTAFLDIFGFHAYYNANQVC